MSAKKNLHQETDRCHVRCIHVDRVERARKTAALPEEIERMAGIFGAISDPTRLKMLLALQNEPMCVCDLAAFLEISESAASHQLRRLKDRSLVKARREGQVLYYSLDDDHVRHLLETGLAHAGE